MNATTVDARLINYIEQKIQTHGVVGVSGVKGESETTYRTGNVNITQANVGVTRVANSDIDNIMSS